jgi:uncharacterized membrane protein YqjE
VINEQESQAQVEPGVEPTGKLIRTALEETRDLVRLEVALARIEVLDEIAQAKRGAITLGVAVVTATAAFTMFLVAIALAFDLSWCAALIIGGALLVVAASAGALGWRAVPKAPLAATRARLESDYLQLKERIV